MKTKHILSLIILLTAISNRTVANTDTTYKFYGKNWEECTPDTAHYYSKVFKDNNIWHRQDFYVSNNQIQMDRYAEDSSFKKHMGTCKYYYQSGILQEEIIYSNYKEKTRAMFYENGAKKYYTTYGADGYEINEQSWKPDGTQSPQYIAFRKTKFKGGSSAWKNFLNMTLKAEIPSNNGAPAGLYSVMVSFTVGADGNLKNIYALNDPGYGTAAEAVRVINLSNTLWTPAIEDNKRIDYRLKQQIGFIVEDDTPVKKKESNQ